MPHVIVKLWPGKSEQQKARLAEATAHPLHHLCQRSNYFDYQSQPGFRWKNGGRIVENDKTLILSCEPIYFSLVN
jgi:hypothetical protein